MVLTSVPVGSVHSCQSPDGTLLFGGSKGLLMLNPAEFKFWDYMPPLVASGLRIDGRAANAGLLQKTGLSLSAENRSFSVEFSALDLSAPEKNQYRYRLKGFEQDWIEADATRRIAKLQQPLARHI